MIDRKELVEKMCQVTTPHTAARPWEDMGWNRQADYKQGMDAALSVAIEELLKPEPDGEFIPPYWVCIREFMASRRAKLERVKTPEERVTVCEKDGHPYSVKIDGKLRRGFGIREDAEIFRLGLIAKLKADSA